MLPSRCHSKLQTIMQIAVFSVSAGLLTQSALQAQGTSTATSLRASNSIENIQLFSSGKGYLINNDRLLATSSAGNDWRDVTPIQTGSKMQAEIFVSAEEGFAVLQQQDPSSDEIKPVSFDLYHTTTAGNQWSKLATLPVGKDIDRLGAGTFLNFSDAQHGWIELKQPSSSAFSFGDMLSTSDGGVTWQMLPAPPLIEDMLFTSATVGYLFESNAGRELYRTGDGGRSWQQLSLLDTAKLYKSNSLELSVPFFSDPDHGSVTLTVTGSGTRFFRSEAVTSDGGKTWASKPIDYGRPLTADTDSLAVPVAHGKATVLLLPQKGLVTSGVVGTDNTASLLDAIETRSYVMATYFSGDHDGWVLMHSGFCNAARTKCPQTDTLLMTRDGGISYKNVTPKSTQAILNPANSAVDEGVLAWDQRDSPNLDQINAWVG